MLSDNFFLLRNSPLRYFNKKNLWMIFSIIYLDMYDLALYIGYAIYLSPILFPNFNLYQSELTCSLILLASQIAKIAGFIRFNLRNHQIKQKVGINNLLIINMCYAGIFIILSITKIVPIMAILILFILLRMIQGFAIGKEIGMVVSYSSSTLKTQHHNFLYYFILLSGELGILISIFFNRLMVSHNLKLVTDDFIWSFQMAIGFIFSIILLIVRIYFPPILNQTHSFLSLIFIATIKKDWINIILRSIVTLFQVLLIFMVIFRVPNLLHLGMGWHISAINHLVIFMAIFAFLGANTITFLLRFLSPYTIIRFFYLLSICIVILWIILSDKNNYLYTMILYALAYIYGVFLRITPLYLYHLSNFKQRTTLVSKYLSYIFSYTIFAPLAILIIDVSHFVQKAFNDNGPPLVLLLTSMAGLIAVVFYTKYVITKTTKSQSNHPN